MYEEYVETLKKHDLKITPQRIEILQYLDKKRNHPTVDMIYKAIKQKYPSLSKTTVYNSVEIMKEHGIVQSLSFSGFESRYDYRNEMHHHFICEKCGTIIDIDISCPNLNKTLIQGHHIKKVEGYFKGICKKCKQFEGDIS
jgi:Fe2+ or Zn2+ uptake regulation protein